MTQTPMPELPTKALAALAFLWAVNRCRSPKGRREIEAMRSMALRAARLARATSIRTGKDDREAAELFDKLVALMDAAEMAARAEERRSA